MHRTATTLGLTLAAAVIGVGPAMAAPAPPASPAAQCPQIPADRVADAVNRLPRAFPDRPWQVTAHGSSVDCTLNWVQVYPQGATGSSPTQILFFDHFKFGATATPKPTAFTTVLGSVVPGQVTVRFRWIVGSEPDADPQGQADVRYEIGAQTPPHPIDPIPPEVTR